MKTKFNRFYYKPLPENLYINKSKIEGYGIFANDNLKKDLELGTTHIKVPMIIGLIRTPLGGFINHSEKPNCYLSVIQDWDDYIVYNVFTMKTIKKNEEIVLEYGR